MPLPGDEVHPAFAVSTGDPTVLQWYSEAGHPEGGIAFLFHPCPVLSSTLACTVCQHNVGLGKKGYCQLWLKVIIGELEVVCSCFTWLPVGM